MLKFCYHHIGIATRDMESTARYYQLLGYSHSKIIIDKIQNVRISFLRKENAPMLELVEPINSNSPVNEILEKNGTTPYHFCYEVDDIIESISDMRQSGFIKVSNPVNATAFDDRLICFLYHKDVGLIELLEKERI